MVTLMEWNKGYLTRIVAVATVQLFVLSNIAWAEGVKAQVQTAPAKQSMQSVSDCAKTLRTREKVMQDAAEVQDLRKTNKYKGGNFVRKPAATNGRQVEYPIGEAPVPSKDGPVDYETNAELTEGIDKVFELPDPDDIVIDEYERPAADPDEDIKYTETKGNISDELKQRIAEYLGVAVEDIDFDEISIGWQNEGFHDEYGMPLMGELQVDAIKINLTAAGFTMTVEVVNDEISANVDFLQPVDNNDSDDPRQKALEYLAKQLGVDKDAIAVMGLEDITLGGDVGVENVLVTFMYQGKEYYVKTKKAVYPDAQWGSFKQVDNSDPLIGAVKSREYLASQLGVNKEEISIVGYEDITPDNLVGAIHMMVTLEYQDAQYYVKAVRAVYPDAKWGSFEIVDLGVIPPDIPIIIQPPYLDEVNYPEADTKTLIKYEEVKGEISDSLKQRIAEYLGVSVEKMYLMQISLGFQRVIFKDAAGGYYGDMTAVDALKVELTVGKEKKEVYVINDVISDIVIGEPVIEIVEPPSEVVKTKTPYTEEGKTQKMVQKPEFVAKPGLSRVSGLNADDIPTLSFHSTAYLLGEEEE